MSLLPIVLSLLGKVLPGSEGRSSLIPALLEFVNERAGGLGGLVSMFDKAGVGGIVASWIGSGKNESIDSPTLQKVLGAVAVNALAQKAGISGDQVTGLLSKVLPVIVDKATPNGELPADGKLASQQALIGGLSMVSRLFGK